jgi:tetratricopeptide (TPR) repeat protein
LLSSAIWAQEASLEAAERCIEARDFAGALAACDKLIEGAPGAAGAHATRAVALAALGRVDDALVSARRGVELAPEDARCLHARSMILLVRGEEEAALADIDKAIRLDPSRGGPYLTRGDISAGRREYESALGDYTKAYELGVLDALYARVWTRMSLHDWKGALDDCTAYVGATQRHHYALFVRAEVRSMTGDWKSAIADYDAALRKKDHAPSYLGRAFARFMLGERESADLDAARAVTACPCVDCFAASGRYSYDTGRFEKAVADLSKAVEMEPERQGYTRLYLLLARARMGEREVAAADLRAYAGGRKEKEDWYGTIAAFLTGRLKEEALLAAAKAGNAHLARERECEACWYAGAVRLLDSDTAGAKALFERCLATETRAFREYRSAQAALAAK